MTFVPMLAVTETSAGSSVMDALPHLAGMLMVMVVLAILWGVCALTAWLVRAFTPPTMDPAEKSAPAPQASRIADTGVAPEIVAVIAAAVATATGKTHRIVSIRRQGTGWEKAGRQSVLTSHKIR